eukprot:TRINITY_DN11238_c0_g1_i1.p1 TRINITY_DN11238_c0_g1~~TRINITY_DN11238_c0_g1_i1.p1  ORF type:complete len:390 (+),score=105.26 TRINITY_DN11238_c0_g1_i1:159-1328(+)
MRGSNCSYVLVFLAGFIAARLLPTVEKEGPAGHRRLVAKTAPNLTATSTNNSSALNRPLCKPGDWLRAQFRLVDVDHDGTVGADELRKAAEKLHFEAVYAERFATLGDDVGHELTVKEFMARVHKLDLQMRLEGTGETLQDQTVMEECIERATLLLGLMMLQSASAMVLGRYEDLLKNHVIVVLFLTMLVGAGGNAGSQSVIEVIERIYAGQLQVDMDTCGTVMARQLTVGALLAAILSVGGFMRAFISQYYFRAADTSGSEALRGCVAVTASLAVIVVTSAILGTLLPFALASLGLKVAHAGPTIQVVMDIMGVLITCSIANLILGGSAASTEAEALSFDLEEVSFKMAHRAEVASLGEDATGRSLQSADAERCIVIGLAGAELSPLA